MQELATLPELRYMILQETAISDAGLVDLAACKNLRTLYLGETKVSAEGIARLKKALPECDISQVLVE
jgi:hypothetical protein